MKTKEEIVKNWLPQIYRRKIRKFWRLYFTHQFCNYVEMFAKWHKVKVVGEERPCNVPQPPILPLLILEWEAQVLQL